MTTASAHLTKTRLNADVPHDWANRPRPTIRPRPAPGRPLDGLDAITLDELNARAAFLTRVDRKYVLGRAAASEFVGGLPTGTRALEIDGRRDFAYASTYYDTGRLDSFFDTAHRRKRRGKVRTREYLDSGLSFLEVKTKRGGATVKTRRAWTPTGPALLDEAAADFVAAALAAEGVRMQGTLRPTLSVTYRRATLLLPDATARVTIDSRLTWQLIGGRHQALDGLVIVETKSGVHPSEADRQLWRRGHRPDSISKYATGLASLRPDLPRNRWHRLLQAPELQPVRL